MHTIREFKYIYLIIKNKILNFIKFKMKIFKMFLIAPPQIKFIIS